MKTYQLVLWRAGPKQDAPAVEIENLRQAHEAGLLKPPPPMCGIAAFFSRKEPLAKTALPRATAVLRHRGPDCQRQWLAPDGRAGLGHARLSIIDLTGGGRWSLTRPIPAELRTIR